MEQHPHDAAKAHGVHAQDSRFARDQVVMHEADILRDGDKYERHGSAHAPMDGEQALTYIAYKYREV